MFEKEFRHPLRAALTYIEVLVLLGIIAILVGLLIPAIQATRQVAIRMQCTNKLKQMALALQNFAADYDGRLPVIDGVARNASPGNSVHEALMPYVDGGVSYLSYFQNPQAGQVLPVIKVFLCPADPTIPDITTFNSITSYAANAQVFWGNPNVARTIRDGTSNTISFGEHYAYNCSPRNSTMQVSFVLSQTEFFAFAPAAHRATFADGGPILNRQNFSDLYPVTSGSPPISMNNLSSSVTFQVMPQQCFSGIAQTGHASGMQVALFDASVRTIAQGITPTTYWAAITPSGGEIPGSDW